MRVLKFPKSQLGPILDVTVSPSQAGIEQLNKSGIGTPPPVRVKMLVDTGADTCAIEEELATSFQLPYVSAAFAMSFGKSVPIRRYELSLTLTGTNGVSWVAPAVVVVARSAPFAGRPFRGLIGRDVLDQAIFTCNGPAHQCELTF
jgi:Aspartyl protease